MPGGGWLCRSPLFHVERMNDDDDRDHAATLLALGVWVALLVALIYYTIVWWMR